MKRVCVYCGSNPGGNPVYVEQAEKLAQGFADRDLGLVYGGGKVGIMGAVSQELVRLGGEVIGIIPTALMVKEVAYVELEDIRVVESMHERKALMADLSDAFIAMPGGLGTFEELFETWTWAQLGYHKKPLGLLNVNGYFDKLLDFIEHGVDEGFVKPPHRDILVVDATVDGLFEKLENFEPPALATWLKHGET